MTAIKDLINMIEKVGGNEINKSILLSVLSNLYIKKEKEQIIHAYNKGWQYGNISQSDKKNVKNKNCIEYYKEISKS